MSTKIQYLSLIQVLAIHDIMIKRFGGSLGIRDRGLIESAIARPNASFDGKDLYKSLFDKTAALLHSLLKNHAFVDGNKRTSLSAAGIFLAMNGYKLQNNHKEEITFALKIANDELSFEEISQWLAENSLKL